MKFEGKFQTLLEHKKKKKSSLNFIHDAHVRILANKFLSDVSFSA